MKHLIQIPFVFLFLIGMTFNAWSSSNWEPDEGINEIRAHIIKLLGEPDMKGIDEAEMQSILHFTVNEKNQLVVLSVDTDHEFIDQYLKNRLNYRKVTTANLRGRYSMKVILKNGSK